MALLWWLLIIYGSRETRRFNSQWLSNLTCSLIIIVMIIKIHHLHFLILDHQFMVEPLEEHFIFVLRRELNIEEAVRLFGRGVVKV